MTDSLAPHPSPDDTTHARSSTGALVDLALVAVFAALIAALSIIPAFNLTPQVPVTMQVLAVLLTGVVLGARRAVLATLLYLAVGAAGLPVFANGAAGLAPFTGPTGGFLISFPFAALVAGLVVQAVRRRDVVVTTLGGIAATLVAVYPIGVPLLAHRADMSLGAAAELMLPFLGVDLVKCVVAGFVAAAVHRAFPQLLPRR